jgi:exodeoxyribonuclease V alpha subunit
MIFEDPEIINKKDLDSLNDATKTLLKNAGEKSAMSIVNSTPISAGSNKTSATNITAQELLEESESDLQNLKQQYKQYYAEDPELCTALRKLSLGEIMIVKIIEYFTFTNIRRKILIENPYFLLEIDGLGFTKVDNIAKQLGIKPEDPRRQRALIQSVLETNKNFGNTYLPITILEKECVKQNVLKFTERLQEMINNKEVILDENRIYLTKLYIAECETADYIRTLLNREPVKHKFVEYK